MNNSNDIQLSSRELAPYILVQPYSRTLTIGKDIVKCLGYPKHICLRINDTKKSFAILPCDKDDAMSFKVPEKLMTDHHCVFRITSKPFILNLLLKYELDYNNIYVYKGKYSEKNNAVIISFDDENISKKYFLESAKKS